MGIEKITYPVEDDFFKLEVWNNNIKAIAEQFRTDENRLTAVEKKAGTNTTNIGTLSNLTTTEKSSLVGAINETRDNANSINSNFLFMKPNTFAISESSDDRIYCGSRGGKRTSSDRIIMFHSMNFYEENYHTSYILIGTSKESLELTELSIEWGEPTLLNEEGFVTPKGNVVYIAKQKGTFPGIISCNATIDNDYRIFNPIPFALEKNFLDLRKYKYIFDICDIVLFGVTNEGVLPTWKQYFTTGWYPKERSEELIGSLSSLTTTEKGSLVGAINEVEKKAGTNTTNIGTLSNLTTTEKSSLVGAINEVKTGVKTTENRLTAVEKKAGTNTTNIGTLSNLTTTEKSSLVGAINEVKTGVKTTENRLTAVEKKAGTNTTNIGTLSNLTTTEKSSLVGAINEVKTGVKTTENRLTAVEKKAGTNTTNIGTLSNLTTTEKSSLVGAINEVKTGVKTTENRLTAVEKKAGTNTTNIGTLSNLTTTEKSSLVGAINETRDNANSINSNFLFMKPNTFAISESSDDRIYCGSRGGKRTSSDRIIMFHSMNFYEENYHTSYVLIGTSKESLELTELSIEWGEPTLLNEEGFVTPKGNVVYIAKQKGTFPGIISCNATIDNDYRIFNPIPFALEKNFLDLRKYKYIFDICDIVLFGVTNEGVLPTWKQYFTTGWYPKERSEELIGSLSSLTTTEKGSLVGAINEVEKKASDNTTNIGTLSNLFTTEKSSLVGAINEVRNKVVKISSDNSTSISIMSQSGYMTGGVIKYVKINGFCTVFFDKFYCLRTSGSLSDLNLVNSSLPTPVAGFKINDEITVSYSGKLIGGKNAGGSITFTGTVTYPLYSAL